MVHRISVVVAQTIQLIGIETKRKFMKFIRNCPLEVNEMKTAPIDKCAGGRMDVWSDVLRPDLNVQQ